MSKVQDYPGGMFHTVLACTRGRWGPWFRLDVRAAPGGTIKAWGVVSSYTYSPTCNVQVQCDPGVVCNWGAQRRMYFLGTAIHTCGSPGEVLRRHLLDIVDCPSSSVVVEFDLGGEAESGAGWAVECWRDTREHGAPGAFEGFCASPARQEGPYLEMRHGARNVYLNGPPAGGGRPMSTAGVTNTPRRRIDGTAAARGSWCGHEVPGNAFEALRLEREGGSSK